MNVSQIALSDARASWPAALYKSNARSLSSIARSYSRSIIATLLSPVSTSGLSPSSSARSRHARAVAQSAAAIARSPPRSRSSRAWTPIVPIISSGPPISQPTRHPAPAAALATYATTSRAGNRLGSHRRKCCFALGAVVFTEADETPARDDTRTHRPGVCGRPQPRAKAGANRARGRPSLDRRKRRRADPSPTGRPSVDARPVRGRRGADAGRHAIGLLDIGAGGRRHGRPQPAAGAPSSSARRPDRLAFYMGYRANRRDGQVISQVRP